MEKVGKILRDNLVSHIREGVEGNKTTLFFTYSAISGTNMDNIRKDLSRVGAKVYVSKNRLAKRALKELNHEDLGGLIGGQTAFVWSNEDSVTISKALVKFAKDFEGIKIRGGLLDGSLLDENDVKRLSDLPSREALIAQLLQLMLSPMTRLAGALNAKSRDLLSILKQLSEKKEGGK